MSLSYLASNGFSISRRTAAFAFGVELDPERFGELNVESLPFTPRSDLT